MKNIYRAILTLKTHRYDLVVTSTSVVPVSGGSQINLPAAQAITAGKTVYQNAANQWDLASCVAGAAALLSGYGTRYGVAINNAPAAGMPLTAYVPSPNQSNQLTVGATTVVGTVYIISPNNAGGIAPLADWITTNQYLTYLGYGVNTTGTIEMLISTATNIKHS